MTVPTPIRAQNTSNHLRSLVEDAITKYGSACDLNHIDVSGVTSFSNLFKDSNFTGDISKWDTSNMEISSGMFSGSIFNGDISSWDMSSVYRASSMFFGSQFNGDISKWDMRKANTGSMACMFYRSAFTGDLSAWKLDRQLQSPHGVDGIFDEDFAGIPPTPMRQPSREFYSFLFGTAERLACYLNNASFNHVHFDLCCLSKRKPIGVDKDDYKWSKVQYEMSKSLGLSHDDLRTYAVAKYGSHAAIDYVPLPELDLTG